MRLPQLLSISHPVSRDSPAPASRFKSWENFGNYLVGSYPIVPSSSWTEENRAYVYLVFGNPHWSDVQNLFTLESLDESNPIQSEAFLATFTQDWKAETLIVQPDFSTSEFGHFAWVACLLTEWELNWGEEINPPVSVEAACKPINWKNGVSSSKGPECALTYVVAYICTKNGDGGGWGGGHQWKDHCERVPTLTEELTDLWKQNHLFVYLFGLFAGGLSLNIPGLSMQEGASLHTRLHLTWLTTSRLTQTRDRIIAAGPQ